MIIKNVYLGNEVQCVAALKYALTVPKEKMCVHLPLADTPDFDFKKSPQPKQVDAK